MYKKEAPEVLSIALHAILFEAKALGYDVDAICRKATEGMVDNAKPYRGGSANWVVPASEAIEDALAAVKA